MSVSTERIRVLHVDDESDLTALVADFLEREDDRISVTTATSASAGLEILADTDIDCVISDYDMDGQNGIEFLETVRADRPDLPFVLYTGKGSEAVAGDAISAGVTDYLQKESGTEQYRILTNRVVNAVERYRGARHIERQNNLFMEAQDIATVGAWEYDIETETVYNSAGMLRIHGLSPEDDMSAERSLEHYHPDDRPTIRNAFERAIADGERYDLELRLIDADGTERWVRTRGEPQYEDGERTGVRGAIQDITDRKERERHLVRFKNAVENAGHAVYVTDSDGTIRYANHAFEEITGYAGDEAIGNKPRILKSGEMRDGYHEEFWDTLLDGEIFEEEIINRRRNGDTYYAQQTIAPIFGDDGAIDEFVAIQTDVTDTKRQEEQLRRQKEQLENFASVVSHDLRNPLNVAQGRIELARNTGDPEHLGIAAEAVDRCIELVADLLSLARSGQTVREMKPVAVADLVDSCWDSVETADARVTAAIGTTISADESRLRQLLENLFRNAVEHAPRDVTVRVGALTDGFYVEDSGPGIPEGARDDVFEPGYSESRDGTGFGLSIVAEIATAHEWEVRLTDGAAGGARFEFSDVEVLAE